MIEAASPKAPSVIPDDDDISVEGALQKVTIP